MSEAALVSVVIPTYNRAHLLGRALRSVLGQSVQELQILVVDDASSDDSEAVVRAIGDPRIRYLRHETNRGGSAARNTGIRAATGDYLAFLDSDDEWLPEKLSAQLDMFATTGDERLGLVVCGWIDMRGRERKVLLPRPDIWSRELFLTFECVPHGTPALLVRLSAFPERPLFDERLPANQDWDFVFRLLEHCTVASVTRPLLTAYRDEGRHIGTIANRCAARRIILEKYADQLARQPRVLALHHRALGFMLAKSGDLAAARRHLWLAASNDPAEWRHYAWWLGAAFGSRGLRATEKLLPPRTAARRVVAALAPAADSRGWKSLPARVFRRGGTAGVAGTADGGLRSPTSSS